VKTLFDIESINALPNLRFSDEALMPLVACSAQRVSDGVCEHGATKRQGEWAPGPMCPDTLTKNMVKWNVRDLEAELDGAIRALAQAGVSGPQVMGIADGTDLEATDRSRGCGQVTRTVRIEEKRGQGQEIEVTVYGWKALLLTDATTKIPLAVKVVQSHEHEALWSRALVTQARTNLAGYACLHYGTPSHGRGHNRRDFQPNLINAVVVRSRNGHAYGPWAKAVCLTNAPGGQTLAALRRR
jgi:hypothetical protein